MKKAILWSVLGLFILFILILALAPARAILPWITGKVPGLSLNNPQGSIWSTQLDSAQIQHYRVHNLKLDTSPWSLLTGNLNSQIKLDDNNLKLNGNIELNSQSLVINNADYQLDTRWLKQFIKAPINDISGMVKGHIQNAFLKHQQNSLEDLSGTGSWTNAVIDYPNYRLELGDFSYQLSQVDNKARVTIVDNQGVLDLKGYIDIDLNKRYQLQLNTQTDLPENIKRWLSAFGKTENGRIYIQWQGHW